MDTFELRTLKARLRVLIDGDGPEDLLIVGGVAEGADAWIAQASALSDDYRVLRFDARGIGPSPRVAASDSLNQLVRDALEVLDATGSRRAHVVGSSLGSAIAQWLAIDHPERVLTLTLSGAYARPDDDFRALAARWTRIAEADDASEGLLDAINQAAYSPESWRNGFAPARVEAGERALAADAEARADFRVATSSALHAALQHDSSSRIGRVEQPVLLLSGELDAVLPIHHAEELAELIPHAQLARIPGSGHQVHEELADEFNRQLVAFLAESSARVGVVV
jgi:pimeloyl-ACP methyl ester carboxylesterase